MVFLDPPYSKGLGETALAKLKDGAWINPGALIVYECSADETPRAPSYEELDVRDYGAAKVLFLRAL